MISCTQFLIAQTVVVDQFTRRISAFNIFDDPQISSFPIAINLMIYSTYYREDVMQDSTVELSLRILLNNLPITGFISVSLGFRDGKKTTKHIVKIGAFPISEQGELSFVLTNLDGSEFYKKVIYINAKIDNQIHEIDPAT